MLKNPVADINCLQSNKNQLASDLFEKEIQIIRFTSNHLETR